MEKLQQDQQQLIALKDGKLAETQQALAARQAEAGTPAAQESMAIWPWAIGALLVVAALAWLLMRRRPAASKRPTFDPSRLAARKSGGEGKGVSVRLVLGGSRSIKKKKK